ncbi:MAG: YbcC family protein [Acidobacteriaceae bacterium]
MNRTTTTPSKSFARTMNVDTNDTETNETDVTGGAGAVHDPVLLKATVESVCQRIAPLWPLDAFVAVSPYFGLRDQDFEKASEILGRVAKSSLVMPRHYYREQISTGRIARADLEQALKQHGINMNAAEAEKILASDTYTLPNPIPLVSNVLEGLDGTPWTGFVIERISQFAAAYFDRGQATWKMPWRKESLYDAWRHFAEIDLSPRLMGLHDVRTAIARLPNNPEDTIALTVQRLGIPADMLEDYLLAALMNIGGWASWTRYLRWEQELVGRHEDSIVDLLAIRLAWEVVLLNARQIPELGTAWRDAVKAMRQVPVSSAQAHTQMDFALQTAFELGYQKKVIAELAHPARRAPAKNFTPIRPSVQAAFCIDVRSEVYRRALETVAPTVQTIGFAGFFGAFMEFVPLGATKPRIHLPVLLTPSWRGHEHIRGASVQEVEKAISHRRRRLHSADNWKAFRSSPSSCFSFVESTGLIYGPKLLGDSFGWSRPVPHPATKGIHSKFSGRLVPSLEAVSHGQKNTQTRQKSIENQIVGIPIENRGASAEMILKAMSMTSNFARLILLVGHGSSTVNNPHATGLDCGACAGQTGEVSARVIATLLNESTVREELAKRGIHIPEDTRFVGALHDTTVDEVTLFDTDGLAPTHAQDLKQLRQWLTQAGQLTRMERSNLLGITNLDPEVVDALIQERSRDWSQVFPEWGLAGNAAFIAAPRSRTIGIDLSGRSFLHDYEWRKDEGFGVLELIMTAPMVVANWINMQYYGSVVDNQRFGSGNKVLHNIVGGSIGVLEGNSGDLRVGLPLQSLHNGERWMHEPLRLNVFLEAPKSEIDRIIVKHELVRELVENHWLFLFQIDDEHGGIHLRIADKQWQRMSSDY